MKNKSNHFNKINRIIPFLFLLLIPLSIYWQVWDFDFVNYDDPEYVYGNQNVRQGISIDNLINAFTTIQSSNWHPVTMLSHMIDCHLFGLHPGFHHITNVIFHIINTFLLFIVLWKMTNEKTKSLFVAALFSLHPLHVESVAWISERKDVLSTFFMLLVIWQYYQYSKKTNLCRYMLVCFFFTLGLMSKPMLVTLPCILLLLDFWPLNRISHSGRSVLSSIMTSAPRLLYEKIPLFLLTITSSIITFYSQQSFGAVKSFESYSLSVRILNAMVTYIRYIEKMIWPTKMAVFYPHNGIPPTWEIGFSILFILSIFWIAVRKMDSHPYLIIGWLWYMGTLVPVIGLIQVGGQAMADRYTYIPFIGLFIIMAWSGEEFFTKHQLNNLGYFLAAAYLVVLAAGSWNQTGYWKNSVLLYTRTIQETDNNFVAHLNLGNIYADQKKFPQAIYHFQCASAIKPNLAEAYNNLGAIYTKTSKFDEAIAAYTKSLEIAPDYPEALNNLGNVLTKSGKPDEAIKKFSKAIELKQDYAEAHNNIGLAFEAQGQSAKAIEHFKKAIEIKPNSAPFYNNLGATMFRGNKYQEAVLYYQQALKIEPNSPGIHKNLADAFLRNYQLAEAIGQYRETLRLDPNFPETDYFLKESIQLHKKIKTVTDRLKQNMQKEPYNSEYPYKIGNVYKHMGRLKIALQYFIEAHHLDPKSIKIINAIATTYIGMNEYTKSIDYYKKIVAIQPKRNNIYYNIACIHAIQNQAPQAIEWLQKAIDNGYHNWALIESDPDLQNIRGTQLYKQLLTRKNY